VGSCLGSSDSFGYLADEFVISTVLKRRWSSITSDYVLPLQEGLRISQQQHTVNVTVFGSLSLDSLDSVILTTDSVTGNDCIELSGRGTAAAGSIQLPDAHSRYLRRSTWDLPSARRGAPEHSPRLPRSQAVTRCFQRFNRNSTIRPTSSFSAPSQRAR
jgi:hypothetical protein